MQILQEAESEGMLNICRKFELSQALFYRWKHQFEHKGKDGLLTQYKTIDGEFGRFDHMIPCQIDHKETTIRNLQNNYQSLT